MEPKLCFDTLNSLSMWRPIEFMSWVWVYVLNNEAMTNDDDDLVEFVGVKSKSGTNTPRLSSSIFVHQILWGPIWSEHWQKTLPCLLAITMEQFDTAITDEYGSCGLDYVLSLWGSCAHLPIGRAENTWNQIFNEIPRRLLFEFWLSDFLVMYPQRNQYRLLPLVNWTSCQRVVINTLQISST